MLDISGNALPEVLYFAATTQFEESFLLTGGYGKDESDKIYKYNGASDSWTLMDTRLMMIMTIFDNNDIFDGG